MGKINNLVGQVFGKLTVTEEDPVRVGLYVAWICRCECGGVKSVSGNTLRLGNCNSCGCLSKGRPLIGTEGLMVNPLYGVWRGMIQRCIRAKGETYQNYAARGITVCQEWLDSFQTFAEDMGERPEGYSLDRINNDLGYYKENCKWSTMTEQSNNRTNNVWVDYKGETKTIAQWAVDLGMTDISLRMRLTVLGWDTERAFTQPVLKRSRATKVKPPAPEKIYVDGNQYRLFA